MTSTAVATIKERSTALAAYFQSNADKFASFMKANDVPKFLRVVNNAILKDPQIAEASTTSVFLECQKAASDGLVLDGREAALTRFKSKKRVQVNGKWEDQWSTEVVYIPMIRGLRKIVSQSPQIAMWDAALVYENEYSGKDEQGRDRFVYERGIQPVLVHRPIIVGERGPVVAAYSVVKLRNGEVLVDLLTRGQLDKIKNRTKSRKAGKNGELGEITGPWASDEDEMFIKTVARHHFKQLPLTDKASAAFERVDALYDMDGDDAHVIEPDEITPPPKAIANKRKTSAAKKLAEAEKQEPAHDPETGEVDGEEEAQDEPGADAGFSADDDF